ncbi:hypothetical protein Lfu02_61420 [Longispora fulva]|nr:hypothetical protein Lfu02_61420 [Longispora fulva]
MAPMFGNVLSVHTTGASASRNPRMVTITASCRAQATDSDPIIGADDSETSDACTSDSPLCPVVSSQPA